MWRLSAEELATATDEAPAEVISSDELTPGMRLHQERALANVLRSFGLKGVEGVQLEGVEPRRRKKRKERT